MSSNEPPPPNPILSAYESFVRDTPLVTRYTITTLFVSWSLSFVKDPAFALSNIPYFTIYKFELYRILLSPLVCQSILSLVFAYISFVDHGKRLEFSMGSTAFAWLMLTISGLTNIGFLAICFLLNALKGDQGYLYLQSTGIWTILFGLIAIECCKAPALSQRRLFFFNVPTLYYPLALFGLFSLIGGFSFAYLLSVGVGYGYGYGYLEKLKLSDSRFKQWEDGILANFSRREGWVAGVAATGSNAWNDATTGSGGSIFQRGSAQQGGGGGGGAVAGPGPVQPPQEPKPVGFPSSGGRPLGGASRRPAASEARAAMLEAAERRSAASGNEENV